LGVFSLVVVLAVFGESFWWVQTQYTMSERDLKTGEIKETTGFLPWRYALHRPFWQFGLFVPKPKLLTVLAGDFQMGSKKGLDSEKPLHKVVVSPPFAMSQHEVTFAEYDYYVWRMHESGLTDVQYPGDQGWGRDTRPVINVSWDDAQGYVNWLSKETGGVETCRLPSEAEWEYAARAGTSTDYFWGNEIGKNNANCAGCNSEWDGKQTAPAGSFPANKFGLQDMHGNVYEWVQDCSHDGYQGAPADGTAWESGGGDCDGRVVRGGSWDRFPANLRSSIRGLSSPAIRRFNVGFRVVCGLPLTGG
jgi:formylglycine-generating enzyme required for sulfatase activity